MKDEKIAIMANMLQDGATMLDKNCPNCSNILFKLKNNNIYCPICKQNVLIVKNEKEKKEIEEKQKTQYTKEHSFFELNNFFSQLIQKSINQLKNINDFSKEKKILENIILMLDIIKKLRDLKEK